MCGIAGLIHRNRVSDIGSELTAMLRSLKHRGPDSTGFAVYGEPQGGEDCHVLRFKVAEQEDLQSGSHVFDLIAARRAEVEKRVSDFGIKMEALEEPTPYAVRCRIRSNGDLAALARRIEEIEGVEILSLGRALELVKDLGDAEVVAKQYALGGFHGTHGIGHTRMATESDVDIRSAHPYWAFPYHDISVVHNGQITNYWLMRRELERKKHRFLSNCDSELLAVYTAHNLENGISLEDSMRRSIEEIDGVFTYLIATKDQLGMAKDTMAAKPMVLYESEDFVALASEEVAIRSIVPHEIDTVDPYDEEVRVWQA